MRIAIFISGRGSNFISIHENISKGFIPNTEISLVFSNNPQALGLEYAESKNLPSMCLASKGCTDRAAYDNQIVNILNEHKIDLVCLAGYMRILSPEFTESYHGRIINIHPSLLPSFKGANAQKQALDYGVRFTGCTVHFVDAGMDTGAIINQRVVPILEGDTEETLSMRILNEEHVLYPETVRMFAEGKIILKDGRVIIKG